MHNVVVHTYISILYVKKAPYRSGRYWNGNPIKRGVLHNYAQLVGCASEGANVGA